MRFSVSVPVLSEQTTVTDPSVSTAGSLRTRAFRRAIRRAPRARATVTTAGSPSGIAATARLTATRNIVSADSPRATPAAKTIAHTTSARTASDLPSGRQSPLERRLAAGVLLEELGDPTERRRHAGGEDDAHAPAVCHRRPAEGDVALVGEDALGHVGKRLRRLLGGLGLAGQRRFVDPKRPRLREADVGRDDVAGLQPEDVARHHLGRGHEQRASPAHDPRHGAGHPLEGLDRLLGAVLLDEADDPVEDDDRQDHDGVLGVAQDRGDHGRDQQHDDHRVRELLEEQPPRWLAATLDQLVAAGPHQAGRRLGLGQAIDRVRAQDLGNVGGGHSPRVRAHRVCILSSERSGHRSHPRRPGVRRWSQGSSLDLAGARSGVPDWPGPSVLSGPDSVALESGSAQVTLGSACDGGRGRRR